MKAPKRTDSQKEKADKKINYALVAAIFLIPNEVARHPKIKIRLKRVSWTTPVPARVETPRTWPVTGGGGGGPPN